MKVYRARHLWGRRLLAVGVASVMMLSSVAEAHGDRRHARRHSDWWGPALGVGLVLGSAAIVASAYEPPRYRSPVMVMPAPPVANVWYFCADSNSYYPAVPECPSGWRVVPAQPMPAAPYPYSPYPPPHY